ncbi:MAG: class I SAM-dependent methyltransferase [Candidatus Dormibacteraeota bacterium]|nr:class I SAM-dependent methyltransferase [Candidatus Dormibacteraeota bacterium]
MTEFDPGAFSRFEFAGWQRKAAGYHAMYSPLSGRVVERLLDAVTARDGARLLDIGSGPGYVVAAAQRRGLETVGLDFAPAMVELARRLHPGCRFEIGDAQALPFGPATFDCVTGNFILHHMPRPERALQEARRVLMPGGRIGLTAWGTPDRNRFLGLFDDAVRESAAALPLELPAGPPMAAQDAAYRTQLEETGFEAMAIQHIRWNQSFASSADLWDGLLAASVRTAALIELQPTELQAAIRQEFDALARTYSADGGFEVPVEVTLFSGRVPGK